MDASKKVSEYIHEYSDWRGGKLTELRELINETSPKLVVDFKWNVPVWTSSGLICAISAFKGHVKINFFKGAYLPDPKNLINSGLDSKEHRSINFSKNEQINKAALRELILAAVAYKKEGL